MFPDGSIAARWSGWLSAPFDTQLNLTDWLLITLLAATVSFLWTLLLQELVDKAT